VTFQYVALNGKLQSCPETASLDAVSIPACGVSLSFTGIYDCTGQEVAEAPIFVQMGCCDATSLIAAAIAGPTVASAQTNGKASASLSYQSVAEAGDGACASTESTSSAGATGLTEAGAGVCARVQLQLDQSAIQTR